MTAGNRNWHEDLKIILQMLQIVNTETHGTSHLPLRRSFWQRNLSKQVRLAAWLRSARSTIEGTAWASRYVLLCNCELGESVTKFTTNVSIKTSCFRSKTPTESSCLPESGPDRSSFASRGCVRVCTCTGLQVGQFRVFCESVPRQILLLGLLVIPGAARGTRVLKIRSVPHFLQPPASDKEPESNRKAYVNQRA